MKNKYNVFTLLSLLLSFGAFSQNGNMQAPKAEAPTSAPVPVNILKVSVSNLLFRTLDVQYERIINRRFSAAASLRLMPVVGIPVKDELSPDSDRNFYKLDLSNFKISSTAFTLEGRFYAGSGYGKGFYVAPYFRGANYHLENVGVKYTSGGTSQELNLSGNFKGSALGIMVGSQFFLGKHFTLDWFILGTHLGGSKIRLDGNYATLTPQQQADAQNAFNNMVYSGNNVNAAVGANRTVIDVNGAWFGYRAGLSFGYRF